MTFTEYVQYQAPEGTRDELIHGEIVLSPSPNRRHQDLCTHIFKLLEARIYKHFVVRMDTTINLGGQEGPRPDVFVIDRERWIASDANGGYPSGSPQLVIEVKSESNSWREVSSKKELFLHDENCLSVWIVDPERLRLHVYDRTNALILESEDMIAMPDALGNGSWKVKEIFEGIISR